MFNACDQLLHWPFENWSIKTRMRIWMTFTFRTYSSYIFIFSHHRYMTSFHCIVCVLSTVCFFVFVVTVRFPAVSLSCTLGVVLTLLPPTCPSPLLYLVCGHVVYVCLRFEIEYSLIIGQRGRCRVHFIDFRKIWTKKSPNHQRKTAMMREDSLETLPDVSKRDPRHHKLFRQYETP